MNSSATGSAGCSAACSEESVAICVTPRERFSCAVDSLRDIVRNTERPYDLVYIDAGSPAPIAAQLADICAREGFDYVRHDGYLPPNRARNLALERTGNRYAAFVDNDLFVEPGWLAALLRCAEDTGAWAVTPILLEGGSAMQMVHMTGGLLREERVGDHLYLHQRHRHIKMPLRSVRDELVREPVDFFEYHCVLLRTDVFPTRAFHDEALLAHMEHLDVSRDIRLAGSTVYFEPESVVRYDSAQRFEEYDREFFELRWCEEWSNQSLEHARRKWGLAPDDPALERIARWTAKHRRLFEQTQRPWILQAAPRAAMEVAANWLRERDLLPRKHGH